MNVLQVACGADMTVVATVTGELYSWGRNNEGQLGIGKVIMKEQVIDTDSTRCFVYLSVWGCKGTKKG